jgi:hypothetical protein
MRPPQALLLATAATLAAMAFMATSAFAQSIEVVDETNGGHCSDVSRGAGHTVSGGCLVHLTSEDSFLTFDHDGTSEVQTSSCANEYTAHIDEDGTGYIPTSDASISGPRPPCVVTPCDEDTLGAHPELEWPISGLFEYGGGLEGMLYTFCIRGSVPQESQGNTLCTVIADIVQTGHQQELSATEEPCFENSVHEITGHWLTEAVPVGSEVEVELDHLVQP